MDEKTVRAQILNKWRRAKKLNGQSKNSEVSRKLNRFLIAKENKQKLSLLDEAIGLLEKENKESSSLEEFRNVLSSESFLKEKGWGEIIGLKDTREEYKGKNMYEKLGISENDDMKNYQIFVNLTKKTEEQQTKRENKEGFHSLHEILKEAKYFEVPENINWMLCNTKNKVSQIRLPYIYMFFDTKFIIEEKTYYGLLLGDISQLREMAKNRKEINNTDLTSLGDGIIIQTFYDGEEGTGWVKLKLYEVTKSRKLNKLKEYIMNLIYFINSEDVKVSVHTRSEKNTQRRIQNGKIPIPTHNKIKIVGYLAKYLDKVESQGTNARFSYRFTVRGHWRHLWNKKFDNLYKLYSEGKLKEMEGKQYSMDNTGALKVWIYPYIKGQGILIDKRYELA